MKISNSGIYVWKDNGKPFYVGKSINVKNRIASELNGSINNIALKRMQAVEKKGKLSYEFFPKPENQLDKWEAFYIKKFSTMYPKGTNLQKPICFDNVEIDGAVKSKNHLRYGKVGRRIIDLETGRIFSNQNTAAEHYGINSGSINHCCHHDRDHAGKRSFCYLSDIRVIKQLSKEIVLKIIGNCQSDEIEFIRTKTNLEDTYYTLKSKTKEQWEKDVVKEYSIYKNLLKL